MPTLKLVGSHILKSQSWSNSGTKPHTEMAYHFLEIAQHETHENIGFVFLGQKIKGSDAKSLEGLNVVCKRLTARLAFEI